MTKIKKLFSKIELKYTELLSNTQISFPTYLLHSLAFVDTISFLSKIFFFSLKNLCLFAQILICLLRLHTS